MCWVFGKCSRGTHLDYSAEFRVQRHEHVRIHNDGEVEELPTYRFDGGDEHDAHNLLVSELLESKGLVCGTIALGAKVIYLNNLEEELLDYDGTQIVMTDELVLFWKSPAVFCQWSLASFEVDGVAYSSAEQFMMAGKARLFGDECSLQAIMNTDNPADQQAIGRRILGYREDVWINNRYPIVLNGTVAKFGQDYDRREVLLNTGSRIIAEASPNDSIWGIGLSATQPDAYQSAKWGQNLLGRALMEAREQL